MSLKGFVSLKRILGAAAAALLLSSCATSPVSRAPLMPDNAPLEERALTPQERDSYAGVSASATGAGGLQARNVTVRPFAGS